MDPVEEQTTSELLDTIVLDIESERHEELRSKLDEFHPAETANLLESLPPEERKVLWDAVPVEHEGEVLTHMHDEARATIIDEMDHAELVAAAGNMDASDLAYVLEELPDKVSDNVLLALDADHRRRLEAVLGYEEETAGRLMSTDVISVRQDVTLAVVLRWLRRHQTLPPG